MAQLIKLHHYPSRYEENVYQYSSRFIERKHRRYQNFINKSGLKKTDEEWKMLFFDAFFKNQLTWATTTATLEPKTRIDERGYPFLKQILRMLDDTTLILYRPTFQVGNTEIDCDLVLLTPQAVWCIQVVTGEKESVFQGVNVDEWKEITSNGIRMIENPYHSLSHSFAVIQRIFDESDMEANIKSIVFVPDSFVEFVQYGSLSDVIDRTKMKDWVSQINHHRSTLKHGQLRAAEILLNYTKTIAVGRV